jgi:ribose-phosphate pyrophosphokinase
MKLLTCNSNIPLATKIAEHLGVPLTRATIRRFSDMEIFVEIQENVRGEDVFVIQSTGCPANDSLMELLITIDALKRGSARRITAVIPYYGYARQDRKSGPRTPISAKLVANLITTAGANRVLTFDLHSGQIQGFFDIPTDNIFVQPVFFQDISVRLDLSNCVVVSPDIGGVLRARSMANRLKTDLAIIDKRRPKPGQAEVMNIIGDIAGKDCILIDDIVDSAGTLCKAATALMEQGAASVRAYASHGVFSGEAVARIEESPLVEIVVSDSLEPHGDMGSSRKIRQLSLAELTAKAIDSIAHERSISSLFDLGH